MNSSPTLGKWLWAALIVVVGVGMLEQYDARMAWALAAVILLAVFLRYPAALNEIGKIFHLGHSGTTPPERR